MKAGSFMYCQWECQLISSLQKATCNMNLFHFWEFILHIYLHTCKMAEVQWCLVLICIFWLPSEVTYLFIGFDHFSVSLAYQSVGVVFVCFVFLHIRQIDPFAALVLSILSLSSICHVYGGFFFKVNKNLNF